MNDQENSWYPTEEEIKDIFRNEGFHISDNCPNPVGIYDLNENKMFYASSPNEEVDLQGKIAFARDFYLLYTKEDIVTYAKKAKSDGANVFVFHELSEYERMEPTVAPKNAEDSIRDFHNAIITKDFSQFKFKSFNRWMLQYILLKNPKLS